MGASILAPVLLLALLSGAQCNQPFTPELISSGLITMSNHEFGWRLYEALRSQKGNLAISPLSAQTVLTMVWLGANGTTARQLEAGVDIMHESEWFMVFGFNRLLTALQSTPTVTVDIANKLYLQQDFQVNATFKKMMEEGFHSEVQQVDFVSHLEEVRTSINQWVDEKTHGNIKDVISEGTLCEHTVLLAVNALYFMGGWSKPFNEQLTAIEPFHVTSNKTVNVSMMHQKEYFFYYHNSTAGYKVLLMKYRGENDNSSGANQNTMMMILLPDEIDGLARLESQITGWKSFDRWRDLTQHVAYREVNVSLPRFKIESNLQLVPALNKLGITELFKDGADLSGITQENIHLSKVVQKTVVEVTEKGTEAAAATVVEAIPMAAFPPLEFKADHPFMIVIRNHVQRVNLFIGRVVQPN